MLKFEILDASGNVSKVFETDKTVIKVGKLQTNDLIINDISVAPIHAQITVINASSIKIKDRGMGNGSYINDQQIAKGGEQECSINNMLRFGKINIRVTGTQGAGLPSEDQGSAVESPVIAAAPTAGQPSQPNAAPVPSQPAIPAATPMPSKPAFSNKPAAKAAAFGGFNTASAPPQKKIIRKKRPVSFERRFLSEKCPEGRGTLEVALIWRDDVQLLRSYKNNPGNRVRIGSRNVGKDHVDIGIEDPRLGGDTTLLLYEKGQWFLHLSEEYSGFLIVDPSQFGSEKLDIKKAASSFGPASDNGRTIANKFAVPIDGMTRAKLTFCNNDSVSILIHLARPNTIALPFFGNVNKSMISSLAASFLLHFALFSFIIFATDRVDALMIDRILTTSRFAEALIQPEEEQKVEEEEKQDEIEPEEPVEEDNTAKIDAEPTPFAATASASDSGTGMSRSEAIGVAQATGLLAQANAMNSMLAVGANLDNMDLDWSSFDANAAAASAGYGIGMTGSGGGGAAMGGFGAGGFGPGGRGGGGAVGAAARSHAGNLGEKSQSGPTMKALPPEVGGSLDKRVIQKVVRSHFGELRACYEKELAKIKGLSGKVQVTWLVSADGNVANAVVSETTLKNKNVETCIANAIKRWRFPKPTGGAACKVTYPFVLESGSSD